MSVLGLKLGYEMWPEPLGFPSGSNHILPYIPPLVLIGIQDFLTHFEEGPIHPRQDLERSSRKGAFSLVI